MKRAEALKIRANLQTAVQSLDDQTALEMVTFYPSFAELCDKSYTADKQGYKFQYNGELYKTVQPGYTFVSHYVPGVGTESLFERIDETHRGTIDDPIPYNGNMVLTNGLYYVQDEVVYLCTRDTGTAVYHPLSALVGLYVETI